MIGTVLLAIPYLLALVFLVGGIVNLVGPAGLHTAYANWGYPGWFNYVTALLELLTCVLIALPQFRLYGMLLGAVILLAALLTLAVHREWSHMAPAIIMLALMVVWRCA